MVAMNEERYAAIQREIARMRDMDDEELDYERSDARSAIAWYGDTDNRVTTAARDTLSAILTIRRDRAEEVSNG